MALNKKPNRTALKDLPVAEQELSDQEMDKVQGGKTYTESRSNTAAVAPTPEPTAARTPAPPTGIVIDQSGVK